MKKILLAVTPILFLSGISMAQLGKILKRKAGDGVEQGARNATERTIDKVLTGKQKNKDADTAKGKQTTPVAAGSSSVNVELPGIINFEWEVRQRIRNEEGGYRTPGYYFTTNGDYAAVIPPPEEKKSFTMMIYTKEGRTLVIDDKKKTITLMRMLKVIGEGAAMSKEAAEQINKAPLKKEKDEEFTISKTGKTKKILGYTAEEYLLKNNEGKTTQSTEKTGTASFWYAKVPFDPIRIYSMGIDRPSDLTKMKNDPKMKNNIAAIPMLNINFLQVEIESGGIKGFETLKIEKVNHTFRTAGYTVKDNSSPSAPPGTLED